MFNDSNVLTIGKITGTNDATSTSTSTSSTTRVRAREVLEHAGYCGLQPSPRMADWIVRICEHNWIEPQVLIEILNETAEAPRPSWRYFAAIVKQVMPLDESTYTLDQWYQRQTEWERLKGRMPY